MSGELVTRVLERPDPSSPTARLVLVAIADRIRKPKGAEAADRYISFSELARLTGLNRATVIRQVAALEAAGHVAVIRRDRQASIYRFPSRTARLALVAESDQQESDDATESDQLVAQRDHPSRTARPLVVAQRDPIPDKQGTPDTPGDSDSEEGSTAREPLTQAELQEQLTTWRAAAALGSRSAQRRVEDLEASIATAAPSEQLAAPIPLHPVPPRRRRSREQRIAEATATIRQATTALGDSGLGKRERGRLLSAKAAAETTLRRCGLDPQAVADA